MDLVRASRRRVGELKALGFVISLTSIGVAMAACGDDTTDPVSAEAARVAASTSPMHQCSSLVRLDSDRRNSYFEHIAARLQGRGPHQAMEMTR